MPAIKELAGRDFLTVIPLAHETEQSIPPELKTRLWAFNSASGTAGREAS